MALLHGADGHAVESSGEIFQMQYAKGGLKSKNVGISLDDNGRDVKAMIMTGRSQSGRYSRRREPTRGQGLTVPCLTLGANL
jgi:hypothetical protein